MFCNQFQITKDFEGKVSWWTENTDTLLKIIQENIGNSLVRFAMNKHLSAQRHVKVHKCNAFPQLSWFRVSSKLHKNGSEKISKESNLTKPCMALFFQDPLLIKQIMSSTLMPCAPPRNSDNNPYHDFNKNITFTFTKPHKNTQRQARSASSDNNKVSIWLVNVK